ncbi:hypothetical protein RIR_jg19947.t1 [Rhizophagus irregularis DAOM 181602=DAOM 197198]|nr:hypothetical protein RIR_jg19947.t1 [Rhizophagus irregularis DAOM 181602=DAOM 197198]
MFGAYRVNKFSPDDHVLLLVKYKERIWCIIIRCTKHPLLKVRLRICVEYSSNLGLLSVFYSMKSFGLQ